MSRHKSLDYYTRLQRTTMSFGYSISDAFLLTQLAWKTVQNSRKACGEQDGLTREVSGLHTVIRRLEQEVERAESPINTQEDNNADKEALQDIMHDCGKVLRILDEILEKYNALSEDERSGRKLWQKVRFGNGKMGDLNDLRAKLVLYNTSMAFHLNIICVGTVGKIQQKMIEGGGVLKEIQMSVNNITTHFISKSNDEGSVFTTYAGDDKGVWREFRRELCHNGFSSETIQKHKTLIMDYIKELGERGLLDELEPPSGAEEPKTRPQTDGEVESFTHPTGQPKAISREAKEGNGEVQREGLKLQLGLNKDTPHNPARMASTPPAEPPCSPGLGQSIDTLKLIERQGAECSVCRQIYVNDDIERLKCSHVMCHTCLCCLFIKSVDEKTLISPTCCRGSKPIVPGLIGPLLSRAFKKKWNRYYKSRLCKSCVESWPRRSEKTEGECKCRDSQKFAQDVKIADQVARMTREQQRYGKHAGTILVTKIPADGKGNDRKRAHVQLIQDPSELVMEI